MLEWMKANGLHNQRVTVQSVERAGQTVDITVAAEAVQKGEALLRVPENLIVTLDRVFEGEALSELLTTNKLSELACLTLYLSYEKKRRQDSFWYPFIKELDRMGGRGAQGAKSPLLWESWQVEEYLAGSPVVDQIKERLEGIEREYRELDTVWFLAGSLFNNYPYDVPTEAFPLETFTQAFAAVQASVVHLQGVALSRRFALVPLGPPLLGYSSTAKAMLRYDTATNEVVLEADRDYSPGDPVLAWCGPQPNSRLLINYGLVDEANPYDKLPLTVTLPSSDPLYRPKRSRLAATEPELSTQQTFQLPRTEAPLPPDLLPHLRVAFAETEEEMWRVRFGDAAAPISPANEALVLSSLAAHLRQRLGRYRTNDEEDEATIADAACGPRRQVAARLLRIEKGILRAALAQVLALPGGAEADVAGAPQTGVLLG